MEKYLFVDFDGVLVSDNFIEEIKHLGKDYNDEYGALFDPKCIDNLLEIVKQTDAKIIISSSWKEYGVEFLQEMWSNRNIPVKIHSVNPSLLITKYLDQTNGSSFSLPERFAKGLEINAWLEINAPKDYNYCIIDDECFFLANQVEHHVQTNSLNGLTATLAEKAIQILIND